MTPLTMVFKDQLALLVFRNFKPQLREFGNWYLGFGLITAGLAGIGRYWDNPRADLWQHLGLGSVIYCFVLSGIIYLLLAPLKPDNWSYRNVLTFITMTSLPALLYAIPVERFTEMGTAQALNVWFLAIVALWRVVLLVKFLKVSAGMSFYRIIVSALLPIVVIVNALTFLNLEHVIFRIMAGLREDEVSGNDAAYMVVMMVTMLSYFLLPFLVVGYAFLVNKARGISARITDLVW